MRNGGKRRRKEKKEIERTVEREIDEKLIFEMKTNKY